MNDIPHFEPVFPSHAIERCVASVAFNEELPTKAFQKVLDRARTNFRSAGLEAISGGGGAIGIQLDVATGRTTPIEGVGPLIFVTPDQSMQFVVARNNLSVRTGRYVRWQPFAGQLEELILPLMPLYIDIVSVANIQLEYLDRFWWTGDWSTFNWRELLQHNGRFLTERASSARNQWHTHSGWFEEIAGGRRLVNVNVDVAEINRPEAIAPSIAILTLMRDVVAQSAQSEGNQQGRYTDSASIQAGLEQLHNELKTLLSQIITAAMAERIGLAS